MHNSHAISMETKEAAQKGQPHKNYTAHCNCIGLVAKKISLPISLHPV